MCSLVSSVRDAFSRRMLACLAFQGRCCLCRCALSPLVMLRLCTRPATLSRLSKASWWTCCIPATAPPPTELAMMSTHRRAAAGETLCCRSSFCLYALDLINRAGSVVTHCQPVDESFWQFFGIIPAQSDTSYLKHTGAVQARSLSTHLLTALSVHGVKRYLYAMNTSIC